MTPPHERRRAEDVFQAIENDVFPRLKKIDDKIEDLEGGILNLQVKGCAHRDGDLLRVKGIEDGVKRIFEKIDAIGDTLSAHQIDVAERLGSIKTDVAKTDGGVRVWVLAGALTFLLLIAGYLAVNYLRNIEASIHKVSTSIVMPPSER